jgi:hypothetical protein
VERRCDAWVSSARAQHCSGTSLEPCISRASARSPRTPDQLGAELLWLPSPSGSRSRRDKPAADGGEGPVRVHPSRAARRSYTAHGLCLFYCKRGANGRTNTGRLQMDQTTRGLAKTRTGEHQMDWAIRGVTTVRELQTGEGAKAPWRVRFPSASASRNRPLTSEPCTGRSRRATGSRRPGDRFYFTSLSRSHAAGTGQVF